MSVTDFTEEELQIILLDMQAYIHRNTILAESPSHRDLREKIESLINNFCTHEGRKGCMCCGALECKKCEVYLSYEQCEKLDLI